MPGLHLRYLNPLQVLSVKRTGLSGHLHYLAETFQLIGLQILLPQGEAC